MFNCIRLIFSFRFRPIKSSFNNVRPYLSGYL